MNIKKQSWKLAAATAASLAALYGGFSYWAGIKAEATLAEQHKLLSAMSMFTIKSHSYQRGWFSSTETTELELNKRLLGPYLGALPDNLRPLLGGTLRYTNKIQHGPLPGLASFNLMPARALVTTEFDMSPATRKTLSRFFGEAEPITVTNRLGFGGGGELKVNIPKFDYEETLAGVKMNWQGFDLKVDYGRGFKEYLLEADSPGFVLDAASKGRFAFDGVRYVSDVRPGDSGVRLGTGELNVNNVKLGWKEAIPYSIKLNELIYLVTRVRVGEFINPSGELKPSNVELTKLNYQIVTSEQDQFVNTRGKLGFETFRYDEQKYGPLKLDISANHLHGPTLVKLDQELSKIPFENIAPADMRKRYIDTILKNGVPLLQNDPKLVVHQLELGLPSGMSSLTGSMAIKGFQEADLKSPLTFISRFIVDADVSLPKPALETMVVAQARNLFTVDASAEDQPDMAEIDDLAKSLLDAQLAEWADKKLIKFDGKQVSTKLDFQGGVLKINQQKVALPWEEKEDPLPTDASAAL
ncbi:YdgA family protein [Craterilacuibacter sinensis]|uniref:YdgA family protein n=1 Tax=Craterilacuibacter sinensis TaxID=2686017 RepID=UPI0026AD8969|nr:YdgA family protein [Craterilacuibacter sinensis]